MHFSRHQFGLTFDPAALAVDRATAPELSAFDLLSAAVVDEDRGVVRAAGGVRFGAADGGASAPRWARAAVISMRSLKAGKVRIALGSPDGASPIFGTTLVGSFGMVDSAAIGFGEVTLRVDAKRGGRTGSARR